MLNYSNLIVWLSAAEVSGLTSDDGSDGINIQRILIYCPIYREDNIDLYSYDLIVLCLLMVNSFFLFWIMGVSLNNVNILVKLSTFQCSDCSIQVTISDCAGSRQEALKGGQSPRHCYSSFWVHLHSHLHWT